MRRLLQFVDRVGSFDFDGAQVTASPFPADSPVTRRWKVIAQRQVQLEPEALFSVVHTPGLGRDAVVLLVTMAFMAEVSDDGSELVVHATIDDIAKAAAMNRKTATRYVHQLGLHGYVLKPSQERAADGRYGKVCWRIPIAGSQSVPRSGPDRVSPRAPGSCRPDAQDLDAQDLDAQDLDAHAAGSHRPDDHRSGAHSPDAQQWDYGDKGPGQTGGSFCRSGPHEHDHGDNYLHGIAPSARPDLLPSGPHLGGDARQAARETIGAALGELGFGDVSTGRMRASSESLQAALEVLPEFRGIERFLVEHHEDYPRIGAWLGRLCEMARGGGWWPEVPGAWLRRKVTGREDPERRKSHHEPARHPVAAAAGRASPSAGAGPGAGTFGAVGDGRAGNDPGEEAGVDLAAILSPGQLGALRARAEGEIPPGVMPGILRERLVEAAMRRLWREGL